MIKEKQRLDLTLPSDDCSISLSSNSVTVIDSESGDSVVVHGISDPQIRAEIKYYVRSKRWSHNEAIRQAELAWLKDLVENAQESIKSIETAIAEAAQ
jgi:hypothetical protein